MAKIAVEQSLSDITSALENEGHQVVQLNSESMQSCDCCVISGQDDNVMGIANTATNASVINANGMNASDVVQQVNSRIND